MKMIETHHEIGKLQNQCKFEFSELLFVFVNCKPPIWDFVIYIH